jgi:hypothetical protein
MQVTDLTAVRRTIEAGKALLNVDTTQLREESLAETLLELVIRAMREGKPVAIQFYLDALTHTLDEAKANGKPLHLFVLAIDERKPGQHAAAFAALPEADDFAGYVLTAVRKAASTEDPDDGGLEELFDHIFAPAGVH